MSEMKKTPNYQLNLPSLDDEADIEKLNENFTKIDAVLKENQSDNTVAEKIGQIDTKIGEPTDDHNKPTVFGKIAGILKKVVGIDDKVGTPTDSATQQTIFGKIKGIASDVSNGLEPMDNKIGQPTDDHTKQTVFGKMADLKKVVSEKVTQAIEKIAGVEGKVGTAEDTKQQATLFGKVNGIVADIGEKLKPVEGMEDKIGNTDDMVGSDKTGSVMGKLNTVISLLLGGVVIFDTPGTYQWKVPSGITRIKVTACGAGGGAGGVCGTATHYAGDIFLVYFGGAGGGGGAAIKEQTYTVTPGQIISIKVGKGGKGGAGYMSSNEEGKATDGTVGEATVIGSLITLAGGHGSTGGTKSYQYGGVTGSVPGNPGGAGGNKGNYGCVYNYSGARRSWSMSGAVHNGDGDGGNTIIKSAGKGGSLMVTRENLPTQKPVAPDEYKNFIRNGGDGQNGYVCITWGVEK